MELDTSPLETGHFKVVSLPERLLASLAEKLRKITFDEQRVIETVPVSLKLSSYGEVGKTHSTNQSSHSGKKKHAIPNKDRKIDDELRRKLAAKLGRDTPVIQEHTVKGLVLTHNERKKIIAAVSLAEGSFVSVNKDSEFHMSEKRARQINVSYYKVVHIGLSWGLIQFTQDSGSLGKLLEYMQTKNPYKFKNIFGDSSQSLLKVVNTEGSSGQEKWKKMYPTEREARRRTGTDVRGPRVQPVSVTTGGEAKDIWETPWSDRFKKAGMDEEFQEYQLEFAVQKYLNHTAILSFLVAAQIQTALGIALVVDRAVQTGQEGAATKIKHFAKAAGVVLPFTGPAQEKKLAEYLAQHGESDDHKRRVKLLLDDPYRLLTVNLYDWDTFGVSYDK